jgi:protein TonB
MTFQALLFCPDEKTARVTTQVLTELEFSVEACSEPFAAVKKLMGQHFDAVVVDCENEQNATLLFKSARNSNSNQASLAVAVVEGQTGVANAFRIGANLVLTKPINVEQAKSTLRVARGLLRKGTEAPKGTPASAAPPSSSPSPAAAAPAPVPRPSTPAPATKPIVAPPVLKPATPAVRPSTLFESVVAKNKAEPASSAGTQPSLSSAPPSEVRESPVAPAAPASPFQPLAKPVSAATASGKIPIQAGDKPAASVSASASGKVPIFQAKPVLRSGVGIGQGGGAASAPAPAREKPSSPLFEDKPAERQPQRESQKSKASELFEAPAKSSAAAVPAPSFAALDAGNDSEDGSGSKVGIIVVVLVLVLAVAGYFGYSKFVGGKKAVTPAPENPQSLPSSPESVPMSSSGSGNVQQASAPVPTNPAAEHVSSAAAPHSAVPSKATEADAEPEVIVTHPDGEKPVSVKAEAPKRAKAVTQAAAAEEISAPPVLGTGSTAEPSALSSIVESAPAAMPKISAPQSLRVSQGVVEGLLIKKVPPVYPRQAIQMHVQGAVQLQAMIDRQGRISSVKVLRGDATLAKAAVDAVNQWRYKPYFLDGQPVDIQTQITVNFKLP